MKRTVWIWCLVGFALISIGGTLLHFLYDISGKAAWLAPFSGVNESTWEHMKLLYWPMFIFAVVQSFFFRGYRDFWCVKLRGTVIGLLLIPIIFYTYNGAIVKSPDFINIAIFFISAAVAYIYEARLFKSNIQNCKYSNLAFTLLCLIGLLFVTFTYYTPKIGIFRDPLTGSYGI